MVPLKMPLQMAATLSAKAESEAIVLSCRPSDTLLKSGDGVMHLIRSPYYEIR